jgi:hypothetical protein
VADHRHQVTMPARLDAEHTKAAVGVMEGDPFHQASEDLTGRRRRRLVGQHAIPHSRISSNHIPPQTLDAVRRAVAVPATPPTIPDALLIAIRTRSR